MSASTPAVSRPLEGRTALITGGNTGIGRAVALAYARAGADVAVLWFDREDEAHSLVREFAALGRRCIPLRCDVTDEAQVSAAFGDAAAALGHLDILVNNAGIQMARPILETSVADWDRMAAVHLRGAFLCAREAARHMVPRKSGRVICTVSQLPYLGRENYLAYSTMKAGMLGFIRALARELAPHGILVNGVGPGLIDTGFDPLPAERKQAIAASLPLGRLADPADVAPSYVFLAGDDAKFFCGQVIHPNGGQIMHG